MNTRQKKFCDEYIKCGNPVQAALKAGYSQQTADRASDWINTGSQGKSWSKYKQELRDYIDDQLDEIHNERTADAQEVLEYLTSVMRGEHTEQTLGLVGEGVQEITDIEVSERDRLKAAELIGKRYGMFDNKATLNLNLPVVMEGEDQLEE